MTKTEFLDFLRRIDKELDKGEIAIAQAIIRYKILELLGKI